MEWGYSRMMASNLTTLQRNTIEGLTEDAAAIYLRGADRDEVKAFRMACEWQDQIEPFLTFALPVAARPFGNSKATRETFEFIRERHFRRYFPDGRAT